MENYENLYKNALERARVWKEKSGMPADKQGILDDIFPELAGGEDEKERKALVEMVRDRTGDELWVDYNVHKEEVLAWLEKQSEQKPIIEMKSAEESLDISSKEYNDIVNDCLYGESKPVDARENLTLDGDLMEADCMIVEQKPIEWDADDDDKFFFLKARLKDYEDCIIYDEELSEWQKSNVKETTKEFLKWLDSIKERMGG